MIIDELKNAAEYYELGDRIEIALKYLAATDFLALDPGRYEIDGENIFAIVESYNSKPMEAGFWEAHIKHLDVQFVAAGEERLGYAPVTGLKPNPYDEERDFYKLEGTGDFVTLRAGQFAILKPLDAHMPGIFVNEPSPVKKVVVKIRK